MVNGNSTRAGADLLAPQGSDAVEILKNDHEIIKRLFAQLESAEPDGRVHVLEQLKALLTVHNATEENIVYPAVRVAANRPKEADTLYHQQDEAKVAVWELDGMLKGTLDGDFEGRLAELQKAVLAHIRKEEETEFPHLLEALAGDGRSELTEAVVKFRSSIQIKPGNPA